MSDSGWTRERLLKTSSAYWLSCALHAAVQVQLFDAVAATDGTVATITDHCQCDPRATGMLLDVLTGCRLLTCKDGRYQLTEAARQHLTAEAPGDLRHILLHHHYLMASWEQLAEALRHGTPTRDRSSLDDTDKRRAFLQGMRDMAQVLAPALAPTLPLADCRHLLDLGGGPGTFAITFCRQYPQLRVTLFDLPTTRMMAEQEVAQAQLTERITFVGGDFTVDPLGGPYDCAWLSHILHAEGPVGCRHLLRRVAECLQPGGQLFLHEFIPDEDRSGPMFPLLFSLNMLLGTAQGQSYTESELSTFLQDTGFTAAQRIAMPAGAPSTVLVACRR